MGELPYTSIRSLKLGGNGFGSEGLVALGKHLTESQIDELGLEYTSLEVGCDGLSALAALGKSALCAAVARWQQVVSRAVARVHPDAQIASGLSVCCGEFRALLVQLGNFDAVWKSS